MTRLGLEMKILYLARIRYNLFNWEIMSPIYLSFQYYHQLEEELSEP